MTHDLLAVVIAAHAVLLPDHHNRCFASGDDVLRQQIDLQCKIPHYEHAEARAYIYGGDVSLLRLFGTHAEQGLYGQPAIWGAEHEELD
ncbi:MAG: hypothetical protein ACQEXQ_17295 [Bacillota bacterium]